MATTKSWLPVWTAVNARRVAFGWKHNELHKATNVSQVTFAAMRKNGQPIARDDKVQSMLDGLAWGPGSIEAILGGGSPVELADGPPDEAGARMAAIETRLDDLNQTLLDIRRAILELHSQLR